MHFFFFFILFVFGTVFKSGGWGVLSDAQTFFGLVVGPAVYSEMPV